MSFLKQISPHPGTDRELIDSYKRSGDLAILGILYQRYMDLLYGVCLKYLEEPETAKDAVMAIFEELARKLLKHEVDNFKGWLYTLAKNHCLMQLRSPRQIRTRELDDHLMQSGQNGHLYDAGMDGTAGSQDGGGYYDFGEGSELGAVMEREKELDRLSGCLETLSRDQKRMVELFYLESKCYKEIETITGLDWNKVRSLIQNGRRNLKICMEKNQTTATPLPIGKK